MANGFIQLSTQQTFIEGLLHAGLRARGGDEVSKAESSPCPHHQARVLRQRHKNKCIHTEMHHSTWRHVLGAENKRCRGGEKPRGILSDQGLRGGFSEEVIFNSGSGAEKSASGE